jgi:hypothetical protein
LKPEHEQVTGHTSKPIRIESGNRLFVFLICLFISFFIWFLIVLSRETKTIIDFPIEFENTPPNLIITGTSDSLLSFNVSSGSVSLITLKYLGGKNPVKIDLKNVKLTKEDNRYKAVIPTASIAKKLIDRLNIPEERVIVTPEYLNLEFESISGVKIKVVPKLILEFDKQYQLSQELQVIPDSVILAGPAEVINKIGFVETVRKEVKKINQTQTVIVPLLLPENTDGLKCIPETVNVIMTVDKFTESEIVVPIVYSEQSEEVKTFPDKVKITFFVKLEDFKRINGDMFLAAVSLNNEKQTEKLTVNLLQYPSFIKIIKIEPEEVEFLVIK